MPEILNRSVERLLKFKLLDLASSCVSQAITLLHSLKRALFAVKLIVYSLQTTGLQPTPEEQISDPVTQAVKGVKEIFTGPQQTMEELSSGAEDGLSRQVSSPYRKPDMSLLENPESTRIRADFRAEMFDSIAQKS